MNLRQIFFVLIVLLCSAAVSFAQTQTSATVRSYLAAGDSIYAEFALESGDVLLWNVLLDAAAGNSTIFVVESSIEGEKVRREIGPERAEFSNDLKITRAAEYRVKLKSTGGRTVSLGAWTRLSQSSAIPFPLKSGQKMSHNLAAGDVFAISFDFAAPEKISISDLFTLTLPDDLLRMWLVTRDGDSIPATPSVKRWVGDPDKITLRGKGPTGGRVTLRLEVVVPADGDADIILESGAAAPSWVPDKVRMSTEHRHDPWRAVIVPPIAAQIESLRVKPPDPPRAQYAAQSLRIRGVDSLTVARFRAIYTERDSLLALRRTRTLSAAEYDTLFLIGGKAFVPPALQAALTVPFTPEPMASLTLKRDQSVTWFVEGRAEDVARCKLYAWRYDETRIAPASLPDEFYWDGSVLPLSRLLLIHSAADAKKPAVERQTPPDQKRPAAFALNGEQYLDRSRRVWGYYLLNPTGSTVQLVYKQSFPLRTTAYKQVSRWPKGAKVALILLGILAVAAAIGVTILRSREVRRKKRAEELARELENARQVQLKLLPPGPLSVEGLEIYGIHQSMQSVGGDYYDFFPLDDGRVVVCIADVTGHGLPAALLMANFQATLRALVRTQRSLTDIATMLNHEIYQRTSPENFVTMFLAEFSPDRTMISFCNAGHNPAYVVRTNGDIAELEEGGIMLGAMEAFPFVEGEIGVNRGDVIAFYTDGIPEAVIGVDDMFGYDRLKFFLMQERGRALPDLARDLLKRVTPSGPQAIADDMAIVLVRVLR